jgi:hypothetical protein
VGPTHWAPPPCEEVLCSCCGGVVNISFSILNYLYLWDNFYSYFFFFFFLIK